MERGTKEMVTRARLDVARIDVPGVGAAGGARRTELVSLALPDRAGLLLQRRAAEADRSDKLLAKRSRDVVGELRADLHFVELRAGELARVALSMARLGHVGAVVVCPVGVSPGRTALALAVADLLRDRRGVQTPVVTCAVCPPLGLGRTAVPHEVRVEVDGRAQYRLVWELLTWEQVPAWLGGLR
ncbi:DUF1442 domain-containing protein [Pseudofrankia inefficax]|uniref:Uncharacterized protein n=1 Tax=Pseudofrankia inefficax (strain DSM 45817 / CECT 9037 / DDB 130130 / EuI1c) TaxID=298654 RepID=E3J711_PSEI1|nr:DUF1442 domain-containing protein [Pseudofrankia inefficax]ADP83231.1 Protein of unknown function DUF1442 [Pseudofrankia inefficax]